MKSLKTKFAAVIILLTLMTVVIIGYSVIRTKSDEIEKDIFIKARNFADLTVNSLVDAYKLYYESGSFVYFKREVDNIFSLNTDINNIQIVDYNQQILYDAESEEFDQYAGEPRMINDFALSKRVQDVKPSILTDRRIIYLQKNKENHWEYIDQFENAIPGIESGEQVVNIVYPYPDNQTRAVYWVSYQDLYDRIWDTATQLLYILLMISLGGILIGILFANRIISPIKSLTHGVSEIARGNLSYQVQIDTKDEIKTLADSFNKMAHDLSVSTQAMIEKEKLTQELDIASNIQQDLLPKEIPDIAGLDVAASVVPAEAVGGDCYDFLAIDDDNTLLYLGDVTGHGVPASLIVAITNSLFYTMRDFMKTTRDIVIHVNRVLKVKTAPAMFVTALLANWNNKTNELTYTSAGHEKMLHFKAADGTTSVCEGGGIALGMVPDISATAKEQKIELAQDDFLVIYSDGITDAWRSAEECYGLERLQELIQKEGKGKSAQEILDLIFERVNAFRAGYEQMDDMTLMVIKRTDTKPTPKKEEKSEKAELPVGDTSTGLAAGGGEEKSEEPKKDSKADKKEEKAPEPKEKSEEKKGESDEKKDKDKK